MKHIGRLSILLMVLLALLVTVMPVSADWVDKEAIDSPIDATVLGYLGVILAMGFMVETLVEFVFSDLFLKIPGGEDFTWTQKYIAIAIGIIGAFIYRFDLVFLLTDFFRVALPQSIFGVILTGISIGKGSNYIHDLVMRFFRGKLGGLESYQYAQEMIENWVFAAEQRTDAPGAGPVKKLWVEQQVQKTGIDLPESEVADLIEAKVAKLPQKKG